MSDSTSASPEPGQGLTGMGDRNLYLRIDLHRSRAAVLNLGSASFVTLPSPPPPPKREILPGTTHAQREYQPVQPQTLHGHTQGRQTLLCSSARAASTPGPEFHLLPNSRAGNNEADCPSPLIDFQVALLNWVQLKF